MMMVEGFQEEGEAAGKWIRACLTSTQLSTYYVGNLEINGIRRDYEAKMGGGFDLKEFHDELLSFGSPAPKYVRECDGAVGTAATLARGQNTVRPARRPRSSEGGRRSRGRARRPARTPAACAGNCPACRGSW